MNKWYVIFSMHIFELSVEDIAFAELIKQIFEVEKDAEKWNLLNRSVILILGNSETGYTIFHNHQLIAESISRQYTTFLLIQIFGEILYSSIHEEKFLMHAACVRYHDMAIAFSGVSGSGKTTSALIFSRYGSFMGDEYAFLNMKEGTIQFESYPFQLKEGNGYLDMYKKKSAYLQAESSLGQVSYYFSNKQMVKDYRALPLGVIVYPHFDSTYKETKIEKLSLEKFPVFVLESLLGNETPPITLKRFVKLAAYKKISFLEVFFSDGYEMTEKLSGYLEKVL